MQAAIAVVSAIGRVVKVTRHKGQVMRHYSSHADPLPDELYAEIVVGCMWHLDTSRWVRYSGQVLLLQTQHSTVLYLGGQLRTYCQSATLDIRLTL